jgi:hypothetical protein
MFINLAEFINTLNEERSLILAKKHGIKIKDLKKTTKALKGSFLQQEFLIAFAGVLLLTDTSGTDAIAKAVVKYCVDSKTKDQIQNEAVRLIKIRKDKEFKETQNLDRNFAIKIQAAIDIMKESKHELIEFQELQNDMIKEKERLREAAKDKYDNIWGFLEDYVKKSRQVSKDRTSDYFEAWEHMSLEDRKPFDYSFDLYKTKMVEKDSDKLKIEIATSDEFVRKINQLKDKLTSADQYKFDEAVKKHIDELDFSWLNNPFTTD